MSDHPDQCIDCGRRVVCFARKIEEALRVFPPLGHRLVGRFPLGVHFRLSGHVECGPLSGFELGRQPANRFRGSRNLVGAGMQNAAPQR